jgi:hypothetical protein
MPEIALSVNYIGHFEATLAGTIYAANVTLDANLTATLVLGILASGTPSGSFSFSTCTNG